MGNAGAIIKVLGVLLIVLGGFMLTALPFSFYHQSGDATAILLSAITTIGIGGILLAAKFQASNRIGKREGYLIVTLGWLAMGIFSTLPYLFSGTFSDLTNAVFESISGLTTTGASVLNDIEAVPYGILFWRSLTQWIGGMGIIVLTVAIFPLLGIGGVELFVAEAPGPTSDKIHPRIKETAKRLWLIYVGLTVVLVNILYINGMTFFDAINHGLTTMATGGFSTKNASMAHFDTPALQYPILLFMFFAGINYTVMYYGFTGKFKKAWKSDEFKTYLIGVLSLIFVLGILLSQITENPIEKNFRDAAFQIISVITTTGFISADYTSWSPAITMGFFVLLFVGACAGSTSGGIKIIRHLVFFKNSYLEFKRLLHPKAIIRIKIDKKLVAARTLTHILVFLLIYMMLFVIGTLVMAFIFADFEQPLLTAIGAVATSLGNVGPSIGELGPMDNFAKVPMFGKWFLVFYMLLGRLELFTILILFSPHFWRGT